MLWHIKSRYLPNAVSQSPEKKCRFQRRKPANYPRILLCRILELLHTAADKTGVTRCKSGNRQTILSFVPLQRKTQCLRQNLVAKAAKAVQNINGHSQPRIRLRRILEFWHRAFAQDRSISMPKRSCRPNEVSGDILRR